MPNAILKTCKCGRTHTAEEWAALPLVGTVDYAGEILELKNCSCGSTLAIDVTPAQPVRVLGVRMASA